MVSITQAIPTPNETASNAVSGSVHSSRSGLPANGPAVPALRTADEIESIRAAGSVVRAALEAVAERCVAGVRTSELDDVARAVIESANAEPLFLHYPEYVRGQGFPAVSCISVNDAVIHGVPDRTLLQDGDLVSIDCGVRLDGWCADAAITVAVGSMTPSHQALVDTTRDILDIAIRRIRPGVRWSSIASEMDAHAARAGFGVIADYVGHGIGRKLHEAPSAPSVMTQSLRFRGDFTLRPGMVIAVEPMLVLTDAGASNATDTDNQTACRVATHKDADGWTVRTASGAVSCHLEHTIAVTRSGSDVLTSPDRTPVRACQKHEEVNG
ncbi:MAG: type I methionyl aminopeptidase [Phycisphaerales bacterium]|nr:type I methionyl aminopeptidase [Phycisphaerales bacterium]